MKKITKFFLLISATAASRKVLKKISLIGLGILLSCLNVSAAEYCNSEITSNRGAKAYITCHSLGGNQYEFKFETQTAIVSWNKTGSNFYAEVSGIGGTQVSNNLVKTGDKLLTWNVTSTPKPNFYVGVFFVVLGDGEHRFDIPTNEDFAAVCSAPEEDTENPTSFTATVGDITFNSVELLLNATDNTSTIYYTISYGSGPTIIYTTGASGVEKSYVVTGLDESTSYTFTVAARDAAELAPANSPIVLNATTTENTNTACKGTSTEASQGSFTLGYNYEFITSGTDVTFTCELLDTKDGTVAYAWTYNPNFAETGMTNIGGRKFSKTFTGQTLGATFKVECKFAFAGGMAVTKRYEYTVGDDCDSGGETDTEAPTSFTATKGNVLSTSVELLLNATDNSGAVSYDITYGSTTVSTSSNSGVQKSYLVTGLTASTDYSFSVIAKDPTGNTAENNPIVVTATTTAGLATAAPTPTKAANKVISIFSDAYTSVSGTDYNPNWGQATVSSIIQVESNNTLKYANLNYQGTNFGSDVNASDMTHLHIDVWTEDETSLQVYVISRTAPTEKFVELTPINHGSWNSYDVNLDLYTEQGMSMAALYQFKFTGSGNDGSSLKKTVYLDNLYFYDDLSTSVSSTDNNKIKCYPNPVTGKLIINSDLNIHQVIISNLLGQTVKLNRALGVDKSIDLIDLSAGNYLVTFTLENGEKITRKITKL